MFKKQVIIVLFSAVIALIAWILAAYFWTLGRFWLPEISETERLLIGLTTPVNIAIFAAVFIATYVVTAVIAFKVKPLK